jgi:rfaE bifunctional protein kinase chain/domain
MSEVAAVVPAAARLAQARILVVGDAMLDRYWFGSVERISPEAPVPVVRVEREEERIGAAANVAYNVVQLGARASLLTVLGDDPPAQRLLALLRDSGIEAIVAHDPSLPTTVKLRVIGRNQQLLRADFESTPDHEVLAALLLDYEQVLPAHDVVLFSDYGKGGLTHVPRMIELARAAGKTILVDPKGSDWTRYAGASYITPNRAEFAQAYGRWRGEAELAARAARCIEELDLSGLLVTRSEEGMTLYRRGAASLHVAARAREVFDVTGAGDTVIAVLAAMLAAGCEPPEAVHLANQAAGIVVGRFGTAAVRHAELQAAVEAQAH